MKRLLLLLLLTKFALATIGTSKSQWDIATTGADTNGGGFDPGVTSPGTDESTGAGTAITITLTGTNTGTGSPAFSSTTHGPGNFIHIASGSGCTVGYYVVNSQSSGTATFNSAMGTNGNVCTGVIGGPLVNISTAITNLTDGSTVWIRSGTYTLTTGLDFNNGGTNRVSPNIIGYGSSHGDNGTKPLITTATNSIQLITTCSAGGPNCNAYLNNLSFSSTAAIRTHAIALGTNGNYIIIINCSFTGFNGAIDITGGGIANFHFVNSSITSDQGTGINTGHGSGVYIVNSYIYGNNNGIIISNDSSNVNYAIIARNIIAGNTSVGLTFTANTATKIEIVNNTIATNGSHGINLSNNTAEPTTFFVLSSNIIYGNGGWGINLAAAIRADQFTVSNNAWGSNTSGNYPASMTAGSGDVTLSANPFVNSGSQNFAPNSTAGGGTAIKGAGFPGAFLAGSTTAFPDIGGVQSQCSSSSGGGCGIAKIR